MYCKECQSQIPDSISFCPNCGATGDFLINDLSDIVIKRKQKKVIKDVNIKAVKWIKALLIVFLLLVIAIFIWMSIDKIKEMFAQPTPIGFYSESQGVYFVKNGSFAKYDDLTNYTPNLLSSGNSYYEYEEDLYLLNYYDEDIKVIEDISEIIITNNGPTKSVIYKQGSSYYIYNGTESILISNKGTLNQANYYKEGKIITFVMFEDGMYYLAYYENGNILRISESEYMFSYVQWYSDAFYYIKEEDGSHLYCVYKEGVTSILNSFDSGGRITCIPSYNISVIGSRVESRWDIYRGSKLLRSFENTQYLDLLYGSGDMVIALSTDEVYMINENDEIAIYDSVFQVQTDFTLNTSNSDGSRTLRVDGLNHIVYTYYNESEKKENSISYDISELENVHCDEELKTMYGINRLDNTLISMDLETGYIEIVENGVTGYYLLKRGIIYGKLEDRAVYFKESGLMPVKIIDTLTDSKDFILYIISYDQEHAYIQNSRDPGAGFGDAYYFDSKKYQAVLIDENCIMMDLSFDRKNSITNPIVKTWTQ